MYKGLSFFKASLTTISVTFTITIRLFINNQPDTLIIQTLFCYKTLHVSGNLFAHRQFSTVHTALLSFMQSGWKSHPDCVEAVIKNLHVTYQCWMYSKELLMMDKEVAWNMQSFITE
jgi:hypothetical protein